MQVRDAYGAGKFGLSFELYPPKTPVGEATLFRHLDDLMAFAQVSSPAPTALAARRGTRRLKSSPKFSAAMVARSPRI